MTESPVPGPHLVEARLMQSNQYCGFTIKALDENRNEEKS
jgi:hypothetical protein